MQVHAICSDETGIESLKGDDRERKAGWKALQGVFGGRFGADWLNPFVPPFYPKAPFQYSV